MLADNAILPKDEEKKLRELVSEWYVKNGINEEKDGGGAIISHKQ